MSLLYITILHISFFFFFSILQLYAFFIFIFFYILANFSAMKKIIVKFTKCFLILFKMKEKFKIIKVIATCFLANLKTIIKAEV